MYESVWRETRNKIEDRINELDGRRQRPYRDMPRYSYKSIISKLATDGCSVTLVQMQAAINMNGRITATQEK